VYNFSINDSVSGKRIIPPSSNEFLEKEAKDQVADDYLNDNYLQEKHQDLLNVYINEQVPEEEEVKDFKEPLPLTGQR
jgi:hypothetical protein